MAKKDGYITGAVPSVTITTEYKNAMDDHKLRKMIDKVGVFILENELTNASFVYEGENVELVRDLTSHATFKVLK